MSKSLDTCPSTLELNKVSPRYVPVSDAIPESKQHMFLYEISPTNISTCKCSTLLRGSEC